MGKITSSDGLPCIQFLVFSTPPLVLRTENLDCDESKLTAAKNPKMLCAPPKKTDVQVFLGVYVWNAFVL